MNYPRVYADFNNADEKERVRLNNAATIEDLNRQNIKLSGGEVLVLHDGTLMAYGKVQHSPEEGLWVASIDWEDLEPLALVA